MASRSYEGSLVRMFALLAAITIVPVVILGLALATSYRSEAQQRGVNFGKKEALVVAQTAVEPVLDGRPLSAHLSPQEANAMARMTNHAQNSNDILRLRLRDLQGNVVFPTNTSDAKEKPEDEALDAAHGLVVGRLTHLNSDSNDSGAIGPQAVEVYLPLQAPLSNTRVGVLEVYMPYGPIQAELSSGLDTLYVDLSVGLAALWLTLFLVSVFVTRGLRRQWKVNQYQAEHDSITGLPNRGRFDRNGRAALSGAQSDGRETVIALFDLDRFKEVNDTLGHRNGDALLRQVAARLEEGVGTRGSVARLGGDEFGVILTDCPDPDAALRRLRTVVEQEVVLSGLPISVEASVGYVVAPHDGTDMDELMQRADVAMYLAKADHCGVARYEPARDHYDATKLTLVSELRHGIDEGQLVLHYQPKAALRDGTIRAVEALVRWQHPEHGLLYPGAFMEQAEQTDLIDKLTAWVMRTALQEVVALGPEGAGIAVAVNVSARNLIDAHFADLVSGILGESGLAPERLIVEITETALLVDPARAAAVLAQLAAAGVTVSVDDFGIGQTSLAYLSTLPVGELKIDKSFVTDMDANTTHATIVRSIVELGHNLSLRVVAEGVEHSEVLDALGAFGCDLAQGFYIARPMPAEALAQWLKRDRTLAEALTH